MKKIAFLFMLVLLWVVVSGCYNSKPQNLDVVNEYSWNIISWSNNDNLLVYSWEYLNGLVKSGFIIKWLKEDLILSGNKLWYKEKWDIEIPDNMYNWDYYYRQDYLWLIWGEKVSLHDEDLNWSFYINSVIDKEDSEEDEKCIQKTNEWVFSSESKEIQRNNKNILIINSIFSKSWPDIESYKFNNIKVCWVDNGMIYEVSLSNNKEWNKVEYMNDIIGSLNFYE